MHPASQRGLCHLGGRGRRDKSLSPTSSKLISSHSRPWPPPQTISTALPDCPAGDTTAEYRTSPSPDSRSRSALSSPRVLHPGLHKGAFHAASAALCAALQARSAAFTHRPQHHGHWWGTLLVITRTGQRQTRAMSALSPPRGQQTLSISSSVSTSCAPAPPKARPAPHLSSRVFPLCVAKKGW